MFVHGLVEYGDGNATQDQETERVLGCKHQVFQDIFRVAEIADHEVGKRQCERSQDPVGDLEVEVGRKEYEGGDGCRGSRRRQSDKVIADFALIHVESCEAERGADDEDDGHGGPCLPAHKTQQLGFVEVCGVDQHGWRYAERGQVGKTVELLPELGCGLGEFGESAVHDIEDLGEDNEICGPLEVLVDSFEYTDNAAVEPSGRQCACDDVDGLAPSCPLLAAFSLERDSLH